MRSGEVRLADYDMEKLEVARNEQSGLLMIRIDHLHWPDFLKEANGRSERRQKLIVDRCFREADSEDFTRPFFERKPEGFTEQHADLLTAFSAEARNSAKTLLTQMEHRNKLDRDHPTVTWREGKVAKASRSTSPEDSRTRVAYGYSSNSNSGWNEPTPIPAEVLRCKSVIVSCGLSNLEQSSYSSGKDYTLTDYYRGGRSRVNRGEVRNSAEVQEMLVDSLYRNFYDSGLLKGPSGNRRQVILLDCTDLNDPEEQVQGWLKSHKGTHYITLGEIADSNRLLWATENLKDLDWKQDHLIVCICKSGKHRSVAVAELVIKALADGWHRGTFGGNCALLHLQQKTHWKELCRGNYRCPDCYFFQPNKVEPDFQKILDRGAKNLARYFEDRQQEDWKEYQRRNRSWRESNSGWKQDSNYQDREAPPTKASRRPDSPAASAASASSMSTKRPAESDPIRDAWRKLSGTWDYNDIVRVSDRLMSVCLPTHWEKLKVADLSNKSIDSLAMMLDSLQEQDKTTLFNPTRLQEMLEAEGCRPLLTKGAGRASKARTEAAPPQEASSSSKQTPPWKTPTTPKASTPRSPPVMEPSSEADDGGGPTNRLRDPQGRRYNAVTGNLVKAPPPHIAETLRPPPGAKPPPARLAKDRWVRRNSGVKQEEDDSQRTGSDGEGLFNRFVDSVDSTAPPTKSAGSATAASSSASKTPSATKRSVLPRGRPIERVPPPKGAPEKRDTPVRPIPGKSAVKSNPTRTPPPERKVYKAEHVEQDTDKEVRQKRRVTQKVVKEEPHEGEPTEDYKETMSELTGLEPIDVDQEGEIQCWDEGYQRVLDDRQDYLDRLDQEEPEKTQAPRRKQPGDRGYVELPTSDEEDDGFQSPNEQQAQAHSITTKQYKNMKEEQVESDEDGLHDTQRAPRARRKDHPWGGPDGGDDKDEEFLNDERTARTTGEEDDDYDNPESYLHTRETNRRAAPRRDAPLLRSKRDSHEDYLNQAAIDERNYTHYDNQTYENPFNRKPREVARANRELLERHRREAEEERQREP